MLLNFATAVEDVDTGVLQVGERTRVPSLASEHVPSSLRDLDTRGARALCLQTDLRVIRRHYLRSWFAVDVVSAIPFEVSLRAMRARARDRTDRENARSSPSLPSECASF